MKLQHARKDLKARVYVEISADDDLSDVIMVKANREAVTIRLNIDGFLLGALSVKCFWSQV